MSDESVVKKGDIVRVEYDAFVAETGEVFDTTFEDHAQDAGIFDENVSYGPRFLLVGGGRVFEGLDEAFEGVAIGEEKEIEIPFDKAAGERNPRLVELHSMREFIKQEIEPRVGMHVSLANRVGLITAVTAGRVRVDFNHSLAGKDVKYKFTILEVVDDDAERVRAIIDMDYGQSEGFEASFEDGVLRVMLPDVCKYDQKWGVAKYRIVADLRESFDPDTIMLVEEYETVRAEESEETPEEVAEESEELAPEEIPPEGDLE